MTALAEPEQPHQWRRQRNRSYELAALVTLLSQFFEPLHFALDWPPVFTAD